MTEVPEHLLQRAKAARARLTGGEAPSAAAAPGDSSTAAPATKTPAASPAAAAAAPTPAKVEPKLPWVEAAEKRRKIPVWAMSVLAFLPIWAIMYMTTNDMPTASTPGPIAEGTTVYAKCASCHGPTGAGAGAVPKLAGGEVTKVFKTPESQVRWVILGTAGYEAEKTAEYGDGEPRKVGGTGAVMPGWGTSLTPEELLAVVRHERETLSGETFDSAAWDKVADLAKDPNPEVSGPAKAFKAVIDNWKTLPPGS